MFVVLPASWFAVSGPGTVARVCRFMPPTPSVVSPSASVALNFFAFLSVHLARNRLLARRRRPSSGDLNRNMSDALVSAVVKQEVSATFSCLVEVIW